MAYWLHWPVALHLMLLHRSKPTRVHPLAIAALIGTATLAPAPAQAAPPGGDAFNVTYFTTDEEGESARQLTEDDMVEFVNLARCQCRQRIEARIRLTTENGPYDDTNIRTFVGPSCPNGETGNTTQYNPCVRLVDARNNDYAREVSVTFDPLWLSTGVQGSERNPDNATAALACDASQEGASGVWICVESDSDGSNCASAEFVVTDTQNENSGQNGMSIALNYDFNPPDVSFVNNLQVEPGDEALSLRWDAGAGNTDVAGFAVLCADANGNPLPNQGFSDNVLQDRQSQAQVYFTKENLCPDGAFFGEYPVDESDNTDETDSSDDETGGGESGGEATGTGGGALAPGQSPVFGGTGGAGTGDTSPETGGSDPGASDCCSETREPGCQDLTCQTAVVAQQDFCAKSWTAECAELANELCEVCTDASTCCEPSDGCNDSACATAICEQEGQSYCCDTQWDSFCVTLAEQRCTVCGATGDDAVGGVEETGTGGSGTTGGSGGTTGGDTGAGTSTVAASFANLDWRYVCATGRSPTSSSIRITGLDNEVEYQLALVAYDSAGNPTLVETDEVLTGIPKATTDLWELCDTQNINCGEGGFCNCTADGPAKEDGLAFVLLTIMGVAARRRRGA